MPFNIEHFLTMGGYAAYVWPTFISAFVVLALSFIISLRAHRQLLKKMRRQGKKVQDSS